MELNKYTYNEIQDIMNRLCLMEHTQENCKRFFILSLVKKNSSFAYKELLEAELNKELKKLNK